MARSLVWLAVLGCSGHDPPAPAKPVAVVVDAPRSPDAPPAPKLATCLATDGTTFDTATITASTAAFCVGDGAARSCWTADLATGKYTAVATTPPPTSDTPLTNATVRPDGSVEICAQQPCVEFHPRRPFAVADQVSASDDGKLLARMAADADIKLELYDVATGKLATKIRSWRTRMATGGSSAPIDMATFAGDDRVIMWAHATPVSDHGRIYTRTGHLVGEVGPPSFTQNSVDTWHVADSLWAFKQIDAPLLVVVDLATGKLVRSFDLAPLVAGNDDAAAGAVGSAGNTIVYVTASARIGLLDRETGGVKALTAPACR